MFYIDAIDTRRPAVEFSPMDAPVLITVQFDATPGVIGPWLHALAAAATPLLPPDQLLVVGPHTWRGSALTPYETVALYLAPCHSLEPHSQEPHNLVGEMAQRTATPHSHRQVPDQVAVAMTYVPLRQARVCLELRVWLPFPATLDFILHHLVEYFAQNGVVLSGVAPSSSSLGAPILPCNQWLTEQLLQISTPGSHRVLYEPWIEQYRAVRGAYPADPRRSFRAAVAAARRRLRRAGYAVP